MRGIITDSIDNPLDGVTPDFSLFGGEFSNLWTAIVGGIWGLALAASALFLVLAFVKIGAASTNRNPNELAAARTQAIWAGTSLGLLAAVGTITGAVLALTS